MNTAPFPIVKRYNYPQVRAHTYPTGGRLYHTPSGIWVPSVTTILNIMPKDGLVRWRERVGDEEADRVCAEACRVGTTMHDHLEGYVSNFLQGRPDVPPKTDDEKLAYRLADNIKRDALIELDEVWGIEEGLYIDGIVAGRTDLIGVWKGIPAVIDYKSSKRPKRPEWLEGYKMQIAAYNMCHKSMFGDGLKKGVIIIAIRPPWSKYDQQVQIVSLNESQLSEYEDKFAALLEKYYDTAEKANAVK